MKLISSTEHSQGILLIVKKEVPDPARLKNPMKGRYVLLDSIQDPGNIGTIIRTAAAAEVKGFFLRKAVQMLTQTKQSEVPWEAF